MIPQISDDPVTTGRDVDLSARLRGDFSSDVRILVGSTVVLSAGGVWRAAAKTAAAGCSGGFRDQYHVRFAKNPGKSSLSL